ncbi:MAG: hypothetical protein M1833_004649 [Piccolia ochrophora]|nr:MAG: hypothetical protein M1833_004649 [Piccolia ochrophora]
MSDASSAPRGSTSVDLPDLEKAISISRISQQASSSSSSSQPATGEDDGPDNQTKAKPPDLLETVVYNGKERYNSIKIEKLDDYRVGYSRLAALQESDRGLFILRRFGWVRKRILLHLQDQLAQLEEQLLEIDESEYEPQGHSVRLKSRRYDEHSNSKRTPVIAKLQEILKEYDDILLREHTIRTWPRPTDRAHRSLFNWMFNRAELAEPEDDFVNRKEDLVAVTTGPEDGPLDAQLERLLNRINSKRLRTWFQDPEQRDKAGPHADVLHYYSKGRLAKLATAIITMFAMVMILFPVSILYLVPMRNWKRLATILAFTLVSTSMINFMTRAKRHEVWSVNAA